MRWCSTPCRCRSTRKYISEGAGQLCRVYSLLLLKLAAQVYRRESNLVVSSSPVTKTMYIFKAYCYFMKLEKIPSSAPDWLDDPSRVSC
jgi:hypothetical protein